jgi:hypothetical protein
MDDLVETIDGCLLRVCSGGAGGARRVCDHGGPRELRAHARGR